MKLTEVDDSSGTPVYEIVYDSDSGFEVYLVGKGVIGNFDTFADAEALVKLMVAGGTLYYDKYGKKVYKPKDEKPKG